MHTENLHYSANIASYTWTVHDGTGLVPVETGTNDSGNASSNNQGQFYTHIHVFNINTRHNDINTVKQTADLKSKTKFKDKSA